MTKKVQKDKQRSIQHSAQDTEQRQTKQKTQHEQMKGWTTIYKHTHKPKDRVTRTLLKPGGWTQVL